MPILSYIIKRLLLLIPTLIGIISISFIIIQIVPGGPVEQYLASLKTLSGESSATSVNKIALNYGQGMDVEQIEQIKKIYGFDKPILQRYFETINNFLHFNLGESYFHNKSVMQLIISKLPVSISLGLWSLFITYLVSIPLGIYKAKNAGFFTDKFSTIVLLIMHALPSFILGVILLVIFAGGSFLQIFPLRGLTSANFFSLSLGQKIMDYLWHMVLPILSMVIAEFAILTQLVKNNFLEEINKNYVKVLQSKGLSSNYIFYKHILKNALLPIISGMPAAFIASLFAGSLFIENLFSLDGLGLLSYEAIMHRDYPVVLGSLYIFTLIGLISKIISDICLSYLDPRIRLMD